MIEIEKLMCHLCKHYVNHECPFRQQDYEFQTHVIKGAFPWDCAYNKTRYGFRDYDTDVKLSSCGETSCPLLCSTTSKCPKCTKWRVDKDEGYEREKPVCGDFCEHAIRLIRTQVNINESVFRPYSPKDRICGRFELSKYWKEKVSKVYLSHTGCGYYGLPGQKNCALARCLSEMLGFKYTPSCHIQVKTYMECVQISKLPHKTQNKLTVTSRDFLGLFECFGIIANKKSDKLQFADESLLQL